jgi:predicted DNA-binding transcriptional regulator AlpA
MSTSVPPTVVDEILEVFADALAPRIATALAATIPASDPAEPWRLMGVEEVAAVVGRSRRWVHSAVKERGFPFIRLDGGALAFDLEDVRAWAHERRVPAVDDAMLATRLQEARNSASAAGSRRRNLTSKQKAQP